MDEMTRRKLEMGRRALEFCRTQPDTNPQWLAAVARLETLLARAAELEKEVEAEEKSSAKEKGTGSKGKVLQFGRRTESEPTDPAA